MTWAEIIEQSSAWTSTQRLREVISQYEDEHAGAEIASRPRRLAELAVARLRALDPGLAYPALLQDLTSRTEALAAAFVGEPPLEGEAPEGPDPATVTAAADALAEVLARVPAGEEDQVATTDSFRREVEGLRGQVEQLLDAFRKDLADEESRRSEQVEGNRTAVEEIESRLTELSGQVDALKTSAETLINERSAAFDEALSTATKSHEKVRGEAEAAISKLVEEARTANEELRSSETEAHNELLTRQKDRGDELISALEALNQKAEKLVGAVGRTGLSGGFQQWEKAEREDAARLRRLAIMFGVLTAVSVFGLLVLRMTILDGDNELDVLLAVSSLAVPAALGGVATYAGKESARHRRNQIIARRTELELASFGPFIAELPADKQIELTALFTSVFFGQAGAHMDKNHKEPAPEPLSAQVIGQVAEILKRRTEADES